MLIVHQLAGVLLHMDPLDADGLGVLGILVVQLRSSIEPSPTSGWYSWLIW